MIETPLMSYSADKASLTLLRNQHPVFLDRQEALDHALQVYRGMRSRTPDGRFVEIGDCYVEGDDEMGVIIACWYPMVQEIVARLDTQGERA